MCFRGLIESKPLSHDWNPSLLLEARCESAWSNYPGSFTFLRTFYLGWLFLVDSRVEPVFPRYHSILYLQFLIRTKEGMVCAFNENFSGDRGTNKLLLAPRYSVLGPTLLLISWKARHFDRRPSRHSATRCDPK